MMRRLILSIWRTGSRRRGAFTLIELLVAMTITMTFMGALYMSFIRVLQLADQTEARLIALQNGRNAVTTFMDEVKALGRSSSEFLLISRNESASFGNGKDDDFDGRVDEETLNGYDDDNDWIAELHDTHAQIGDTNPLFDRFTFTVQDRFENLYGSDAADLGDFKVDEDNVFGLDSVLFRILPDTTETNLLFRTIIYSIGTFDGQPNVLLRRAVTEFSDRAAVETLAPLAFGVLGLDVLYWDPNGDPDPGTGRELRPYWVENWNSALAPAFDPPRLPLPAQIFMRVSLYADAMPFENYRAGNAVETIYTQIAVNIEDIIGDALYPRPIL